MSSLKSSSSMGDPQGEHQNGRGGEIIKMGYLKKLKTMRKKFFVLRSESSESPARIEYYDNEKKWKSHQSPKRCIALKTCFNINHRLDTKQKYVIALYTKDDCFCLVLESEDELEEWLKALLSLQHGEDVPDGEQPKPIFEHVWQVTVQKKGLGNSRNILGPYHLCLTDKTLTLVKMSQDEKAETFKFSLMSIRRCGHSDCFFYMEVGRSSCTGAGDLWMQTEDTNIAENMHAAILHAMSNSSSKEELAPKPRNRSSSANEASKPISVLHRRQTHAGSAIKPATYSASVCAASLPGSFHHCHHHYHRAALMHHPPTPTAVRPSQRRHSVSAMSVSTGCGGPTHQRTHSFPLSEPQPLPPWETRRGSTGRVGKRTGTNVHSSTASRERCDSMPSRARTTSEGHHPLPLPHSARNMHLVSGHGGNRPHSMYSRGISYSPPVGSSPVSPASGACSTDSAGSSLSIDDGEGWAEDGMLGLGRYSHSLTPDEPVILEENCDDYVPWTGPADDHKLNNYVPMDRSQASLSLPIQPMVTATSNSTVPIRKFSPNLSSSGFKSGSPSQGSYMDMYSPCGSSPLDTPGGYMAMSPGTGHSDVGGRLYNRAVTSANHSRTSSLAEETHDGYVPMAPVLTDDGYIDMDPVHPSHREDFHHHHHTDMSPASSCSITSGTPSTDLRFSEYHLEKVSSYFTPSEEDETSSLDRPIRAYSVGSRPEPHNRSNRLEIVNQGDSARVRAFSVGSRAVRLPSRAQDPHPSRLPSVPIQQHSSPGNKSQSAPLLCNSAVGSPNLRHSNHSSTEPMDDLMEMDFSSHRTPRSNKPRTRVDSAPCNHVDMARTSPYVDMRPGTTGEPYTSPPNLGPYVDMRTGLGGEHTRNFSPSSQTKPISMPAKVGSSSVSPKSYMSVGPYMDMRSGVQGFSVASSPPSRKVSTVVSGMSPRCSSVEAPYVEMRTGNTADVLPPETYTMQPVVSSLASKISGPYVDMKCEPQPYGYSTQSAGPITGGSPRLLEDTQFAGKPPSCRKPTSPIQEEYMDMSFKKPGSEESTMSARTAPLDTPQPKKPPDGYVEMSWSGGSKPPQTSSLEGFKSAGSSAREDYMNMNYEGRGNGSKKKERRGSKKDKGRYSSQPIAIQSTGVKDTISKTTSSSTSPVFSFSNIMASDRKHSTGTSPKIPPGFLPLDGGISSPNSSPYNTLRHNRSTKRNGQHSEASSRRDSCDINSGLNTPTGSTIFPFSLNSPGSPMKPFPGATSQANKTSVLASAPGMDVPSYESSRKCPVDATSGTVRLSYLYSDLQRGLTSPDSPSGTPDSSSSSEQPTPVNTESLNDISQADESSSRTHDYMNYNPQQALRRDLSSSKKGNDLGDYAIMRPMSVVSAKESMRKISAPLFGTHTKDIKVVGDAENSLHHHVSSLTLSSPSLSLSKTPSSISSATPSNKTTPPAARKPCLPSQTQPVISSPLFRPITSLVENSSNVKVVSSTSCTVNKEAASFNRQPSLHGEVIKGKDVFARKEAANVSNSKASYNKQASTILKQLSNSSTSSGEGKRNSVSGDEGLPSGAVSPAMFPRPLGKRSSLAGDEAAYESLSMSGAVSPLTSRPPSVSSERELHYASLDLAPSGSEGEDGAKSPRGFKTQSSLTESSSTSSPSPNPISQGAAGTDTFTYAEIDFAKSEGLRNITSTLNRKVRH